MQVKFFQIPAHGSDEAVDDLNKFLRSNRIVTLDRHFVADGINSGWAICVTYVDGSARTSSGKRSKVDYREVLSAPDFQLFSKLRDLRKHLAAEEGCPVYALFTNEQLADIAQRRPGSLEQLTAIPGVGTARADKFGERVLSLVRVAEPAASPDHAPHRPRADQQPNGELHEA